MTNKQNINQNLGIMENLNKTIGKQKQEAMRIIGNLRTPVKNNILEIQTDFFEIFNNELHITILWADTKEIVKHYLIHRNGKIKKTFY
jgi:N-acetyl-anhydromuramyl-L-alanine amidase AmpD